MSVNNEFGYPRTEWHPTGWYWYGLDGTAHAYLHMVMLSNRGWTSWSLEDVLACTTAPPPTGASLFGTFSTKTVPLSARMCPLCTRRVNELILERQFR